MNYFPHPPLINCSLRWPTSVPKVLTVSPLSLYVLVRGLVLLPLPPCAPPTKLSLYVLVLGGGGLVLWPVPPRAPPTPLSLFVLVGRDGIVIRPPLRTPNPTVSVHPGGGGGGWCCDQAPLVQPRPHCICLSWWGGMVSWQGPPCAPLNPPWFPYCLWNTTHPPDSNSNVLCRIPVQRLRW